MKVKDEDTVGNAIRQLFYAKEDNPNNQFFFRELGVIAEKEDKKVKDAM